MRVIGPVRGTLTPGLVYLQGEVSLGTSGAIAAGDADERERGWTISKEAEDGRYLITFQDNHVGIREFSGTAIVADAALGTNGWGFILRNNNIAASKTIEVQAVQASGADANLPDNSSMLLSFGMKSRNR